MADALVEPVTGRPADVPEPVALNLVMSDQAFPRVGPQFAVRLGRAIRSRTPFQWRPCTSSSPVAGSRIRQPRWRLSTTGGVDVFRPCVISSAGLACARLSPARFYSRVIVAPVVRFRRMVTLLVLLR